MVDSSFDCTVLLFLSQKNWTEYFFLGKALSRLIGYLQSIISFFCFSVDEKFLVMLPIGYFQHYFICSWMYCDVIFN